MEVPGAAQGVEARAGVEEPMIHGRVVTAQPFACARCGATPSVFQASALVRFQEPPVAGVPASAELFTSHPHLTGWMEGRRFELRFRDLLVARGEIVR